MTLPVVGVSVSVCIPTYNNASMVGEAIESALLQTHADIEILILDNASQDETESVVRRYIENDRRVRYVRHERNLGMVGNFNSALSMASAPNIMILCADDVLEVNAISLLWNALNRFEDAVLATGARILVDSDNREVGRVVFRRIVTFMPGPPLIDRCFAEGNRIGEPSAVLFRRDAARRGFDPSFHQFVDIEMWVHLLGQGGAVVLPDPVARIRRHSGQWSEANIRNGRLVLDKQSFFRLLGPEMMGRLNTLQKLRWDARMGSSVVRTRLAGRPINIRVIREVFFPSLLGAFVAVAALGLRIVMLMRRLFQSFVSRR